MYESFTMSMETRLLFDLQARCQGLVVNGGTLLVNTEEWREQRTGGCNSEGGMAPPPLLPTSLSLAVSQEDF